MSRRTVLSVLLVVVLMGQGVCFVAADGLPSPGAVTGCGRCGGLVVGVPDEEIEGALTAGAANVLYGSSTGLGASGAQMWHQNIDGVTGGVEQLDRFGTALATGDFDGDGHYDLAIGVPCESIGTTVSAGAVNVLYGSAQGLAADGDQLWHQDMEGVGGTVEQNDLFGAALAVGDFNGDGHDDLAVGVHGEDVGDKVDAGAVNVLYGSPDGLSASGNQIWDQDADGIAETAEENDHFGYSLAAGDFDGDGHDDLAVGVVWESIESILRAGAVNVLYGSAQGLGADSNQLWHQNTEGVIGGSEEGDAFGEALAAGDFDGDGRDDLAVGVVGEAIGEIEDAGTVNVLYGSAQGLGAEGNQLWHQNTEGVAGTCAEGDRFGASLAAGDFDGDGRDDLAVGVVGEAIGEIEGAGAVNVLYGASEGLEAAGGQIWDQNSDGVAETSEQYDRFGGALAAGDFDGDSRDDLAVGVPFEDLEGVGNVGVVNVLYGSPQGLDADGNQLWHQNIDGVPGGCEADDRFGSALAAWSYPLCHIALPVIFRSW